MSQSHDEKEPSTVTGYNPAATATFRAARDLLLSLREDHDEAVARFAWPRPDRFNWALDWFDRIARGNNRVAVRVLADGHAEGVTYAELAERSDRVANWLRECGVRRGEAVLLMLDTEIAVWEAMLAAMKLGAVIIPTYTTVSGADLADRLDRGEAAHVITSDLLARRFAGLAPKATRICVGDRVDGWLHYADAYAAPAEFSPNGPTAADDPLFVYFTSGTSAAPKMVGHTHASYPIGHLSGMYWNGLRPGDVHANISAPGWAKHAWSSFFGPFNAEATVLAVELPPGRPEHLTALLEREQATSLCAPPSAWRILVQQGLGSRPSALRQVASVGEPLNPEVIEKVQQAWGLTVRDGYGQTEMTAAVGNTIGMTVRPGSMGKPLPGYPIVLLDPQTGLPGAEGEICIELADRPAGVMSGYLHDADKTAAVFADGHYHTGDIATRDQDGYLTYVGRCDDVFKSFDHRISPFELESALLEHPHVADAAVVPVPHPIGMFVPKAYITPAPGHEPDRELALSILRFTAGRLAPHQRIAAVEFAELPKTVSGKIRHAELRAVELARADGRDADGEWRAEDLLGAQLRTAAGL
jgi:acetyl-CoA synthetase